LAQTSLAADAVMHEPSLCTSRGTRAAELLFRPVSL